MDNALNALFSWNLLLFSLGIFSLVWVIRTVVEYYIDGVEHNKLWEKLIIPLMPVLIGALVALIAKKYPYPDGLTTVSARLMVGSVAGMLSGLVYQVITAFLKGKAIVYLNPVGQATPVNPTAMNPNQTPTLLPNLPQPPTP